MFAHIAEIMPLPQENGIDDGLCERPGSWLALVETRGVRRMCGG